MNFASKQRQFNLFILFVLGSEGDVTSFFNFVTHYVTKCHLVSIEENVKAFYDRHKGFTESCSYIF
ncbi:hypothetical protein BSA171_17460 [Bacillus safensis]|nr:hypothetical protein BSA41_00255 [Bacillus safensis]APT55248.1 hypothetical protein BSA171_17460 [Bacillus safensis]